jgi:tripartite-type tricarboxylate transporter receptor subunit TctC
MFISLGSALPQAKAGAVKAIAVGAPMRMALLPDLPALAETVPGFTAVSWFALFGPAGMPPDVTAKISGEVRKVFADPAVRQNFLDVQYFESIAGSPEDLRARIDTEEPRWRKLIQESHITVDR